MPQGPTHHPPLSLCWPHASRGGGPQFTTRLPGYGLPLHRHDFGPPHDTDIRTNLTQLPPLSCYPGPPVGGRRLHQHVGAACRSAATAAPALPPLHHCDARAKQRADKPGEHFVSCRLPRAPPSSSSLSRRLSAPVPLVVHLQSRGRRCRTLPPCHVEKPCNVVSTPHTASHYQAHLPFCNEHVHSKQCPARPCASHPSPRFALVFHL
jgi:hypothetical protein